MLFQSIIVKPLYGIYSRYYKIILSAILLCLHVHSLLDARHRVVKTRLPQIYVTTFTKSSHCSIFECVALQHMCSRL